MPSNIILKKTVEYAPKTNQYLSEVITVENDNEAPQTAFSVSIKQQGEGLDCGVHHHSRNGISKLRECSYPSLSGSHSPDNKDASTLSPELVYLRQLYLAEGWLLSDKMWQYRYVTEQQPNRVHHEIITMQKMGMISEDMQRFDIAEPRNAILDALREHDFRFDLRRLRHPKTENIYISPVAPETERYLICVNYAHGINAAGLAVLLHLLCKQRSDELAGERPYGNPSFEAVLFDGADGTEGALAYFQILREAERKNILGVINLELSGQGDLLISTPEERGNGKLYSANYYASKQNKVTVQKDIASPLTEVFKREAIPFVTIASQASTKKQSSKPSEENLQHKLRFLRDILRILPFVKGDEVQEIPDMSSVQKVPTMNLISMGNGKK